MLHVLLYRVEHVHVLQGHTISHRCWIRRIDINSTPQFALDSVHLRESTSVTAALCIHHRSIGKYWVHQKTLRPNFPRQLGWRIAQLTLQKDPINRLVVNLIQEAFHNLLYDMRVLLTIANYLLFLFRCQPLKVSHRQPLYRFILKLLPRGIIREKGLGNWLQTTRDQQGRINELHSMALQSLSSSKATYHSKIPDLRKESLIQKTIVKFVPIVGHEGVAYLRVFPYVTSCRQVLSSQWRTNKLLLDQVVHELLHTI